MRTSALTARITVGIQALIYPHVPVHVGQTLGRLQRGPTDPTFHRLRAPRSERSRTADDTLWIGARTPSLQLPATLYFTRRFEGATSALNAPVQVCLWAESSPATPDDAFPTEQVYSELEDFASLMPAWLGLHDPREEFAKLPAFEHLPLKIRRAYRENPGLRLSTSGQLTRHMLAAILEQRVTQPEAFDALRWIIMRYGESAPFSGDPAQPPHLRVYPTAQVLGTIPSWDWHRARVDSARYSAVYHFAQRADALERLGATGRIAHLAAALDDIPGVGPWSVAEALQGFCGHPDAVSVGDYHLAHTVGFAFTGERTDDAGMLHLLAPYAGHRQRVVRLIQEAGIRKPRYGARISIPDYRDF
ncbi:3-methyladenine DNA glycosylase [Rothia dentocariosa]|nr:3-methyladenine DNA glycosylase [Rothia dentocariosa]